MNTPKVSYMSSSHLLKGFWSLLKVFMKPEADLQQLKGFIFGRKDVWQPIIYDLYDENYILYNSFRPFLSSSEVQNLQKIFKASVQAFTWLQNTFWRFWLQFLLLFFKWSSLFSRKNRMTFKTQGSGSFFFLHTFFFSLCSLAPSCAKIS